MRGGGGGAEEGFFFCFESFICNPLHAARRAMAAAVPLPSKGQQQGFLRYTRFLPRTSLRGYVEVTPFSFSPTVFTVVNASPRKLSLVRFLVAYSFSCGQSGLNNLPGPEPRKSSVEHRHPIWTSYEMEFPLECLTLRWAFPRALNPTPPNVRWPVFSSQRSPKPSWSVTLWSAEGRLDATAAFQPSLTHRQCEHPAMET